MVKSITPTVSIAGLCNKAIILSVIFVLCIKPVYLLSSDSTGKTFGGKKGDRCDTLYSPPGALSYFQNYLPLAERMQPQNWGITFDKRGFLYAANQSGVLEYDGVQWRFIDVPNYTVRAIAADKNGTVYVGGNNTFGYLTTGPNRLTRFVSLSQNLKKDQKNFGHVWGIYPLSQGIYFHTLNYLFCWQPEMKTFRKWKPQTQFSAVLSCQGTLYIRQQGIGLMKMERGTIVPISGGKRFAEEAVKMMAPLSDNPRQILIGTRTQGLFIYNGNEAMPFANEADDYIRTNRLSCGTPLFRSLSPGPRREYALGTMGGGLVIIDDRGKLKKKYTKEQGLLDNNVWGISQDNQGNLWLALNKGITKLEYLSPFSYFDEEHSQLPGIIVSVVCHDTDKQVYCGTSAGLYVLDSKGKFSPIPGINGVCWGLLSTGDHIIAATRNGVFAIKNKKPEKIVEEKSYALTLSRCNPHRIWVGTENGLSSLYKSQNRWQLESRFKTPPLEVRTLVEADNGVIWMGSLTNGVLKVVFPSGLKIDNPISIPQIKHYNQSNGLPDGEIHVFYAASHAIFATSKGIYRYNREKDSFSSDTLLGPNFTGGPSGKQVFRLAQDQNKRIWFHSLRQNFLAFPQPDDTFIIKKRPFLRLPNIQVNQIYPVPGKDIIWYAAHNGLICYDHRIKKDNRPDFPVYIRQVWVNSIIETFPLAQLPYSRRNLRFRYATPFFENEKGTSYSYKLEGYDKDWSNWSKETQKDYTNLDAGNYRFRVRARNIYRQVSKEDTLRFKIRSPWYRTWWAIVLYISAAAFLMILVVKWRSRQLIREKEKLERIIRERTHEIEEKRQQLARQSEQLKELDKVKSRFFANISHEFRTPLTLIMGPLEQMLTESEDINREETLKMALKNSQQLLSLINQLLELSKLDSGTVRLQAAKQNIIPFLKRVLGTFQSVLDSKKIKTSFQTPAEEITFYWDREKMEKIINNIIANAVKFTPQKGKIAVRVEKKPGEKEHFPNGYLEIKIKDSGPGIPADQLPYIFDRFYQARPQTIGGNKYPGTGIGLALVKELVHLHYGTIRVNSQVKTGTEFIICFPMGKEHLKDDEITSPEDDALSISATQGFSTETLTITNDDTAGERNQSFKDEENEGDGKDIVLVVEDNPDVRAYIVKPLAKRYTVIEAADGEEGIAKAREVIPDIIISDIMMPHTDGIQLCRTLKQGIETSHIPIILLTARASEESVIEGLETGADDYVTKPFNINILLARIKNLISLRHQLQETIQREMLLQPTEIIVSSMDREFMDELKQAIEKNLGDMEFGVEKLAQILYMSRATLNRKVKALTGESTNRFIQSYRLKRAAQLLKAKYGNVTEVAFAVGFSSSNYFTRCFKEKFQRLPHTYGEE